MRVNVSRSVPRKETCESCRTDVSTRALMKNHFTLLSSIAWNIISSVTTSAGFPKGQNKERWKCTESDQTRGGLLIGGAGKLQIT